MSYIWVPLCTLWQHSVDRHGSSRFPESPGSIKSLDSDFLCPWILSAVHRIPTPPAHKPNLLHPERFSGELFLCNLTSCRQAASDLLPLRTSKIGLRHLHSVRKRLHVAQCSWVGTPIRCVHLLLFLFEWALQGVWHHHTSTRHRSGPVWNFPVRSLSHGFPYGGCRFWTRWPFATPFTKVLPLS